MQDSICQWWSVGCPAMCLINKPAMVTLVWQHITLRISLLIARSLWCKVERFLIGSPGTPIHSTAAPLSLPQSMERVLRGLPSTVLKTPQSARDTSTKYSTLCKCLQYFTMVTLNLIIDLGTTHSILKSLRMRERERERERGRERERPVAKRKGQPVKNKQHCKYNPYLCLFIFPCVL